MSLEMKEELDYITNYTHDLVRDICHEYQSEGKMLNIEMVFVAPDPERMPIVVGKKGKELQKEILEELEKFGLEINDEVDFIFNPAFAKTDSPIIKDTIKMIEENNERVLWEEVGELVEREYTSRKP